MDTSRHEFLSIGVYSWFKIEFFSSPGTMADIMLNEDVPVTSTVRRKLNECSGTRDSSVA
jgi:hypothetical protein